MGVKNPIRPWVDPTPRLVAVREARKMPRLSERAPEGKEFLCRETAEKQNGQKRKHDDESVDNDGETDVQAKRAKTTEQDDSTSDLSVDTVLDMVSFPTLKEICAKVLADEISGAKLKEELLSCTQDVLARSRNEAIQERDAIIEAAGAATSRIVDRAMNSRNNLCESDDWGHALSRLFPRIEALYSRGSLVRGPELAWEALVEVAAECVYTWDGAEFDVSGGEDGCDDFHEAVDRFMLFICEAQKQSGKISWLKDGRKEDVWRLQEEPEDHGSHICKYRYQRTLEFLEKL